ncbi:hypothetical protein Hanom_Chr07g00605531 [Helianthus anomalus]
MCMVRIRHFEFVCRSQGEEPTIDKFHVFYQLQSNLGFFSFALRDMKKILISPPKSFHGWKMKFFFICEEVIPVDMEFRDSAPIPKEEMNVLRGATWYERLLALPNRVFGEKVLVAASMSNKWPENNENVPVVLLKEVTLYQSAFPAFAGTMGMRPLRGGEEYWFEPIRLNFMYAELSCLLLLLIQLKKPKRVAKKKVTVVGGATSKKEETADAMSDAASRKGTACVRQSNLENFVYVVDSFEKLYAIGGKPQGSAATAARSSRSVGSKGTESGASPTSVHIKETEVE